MIGPSALVWVVMVWCQSVHCHCLLNMLVVQWYYPHYALSILCITCIKISLVTIDKTKPVWPLKSCQKIVCNLKTAITLSLLMVECCNKVQKIPHMVLSFLVYIMSYDFSGHHFLCKTCVVWWLFTFFTLYLHAW